MLNKKIITAKVTPNAKQNIVSEEVDIFGNVVYKVKTTATPQNNEANKSVIEIVAKYFNVSKSSVKIAKGVTNQVKIIEICLKT